MTIPVPDATRLVNPDPSPTNCDAVTTPDATKCCAVIFVTVMSGEPVKFLAVEAATPKSSEPSPTNKLAVATPTIIFGDQVSPSAAVAIPATPA